MVHAGDWLAADVRTYLGAVLLSVLEEDAKRAQSDGREGSCALRLLAQLSAAAEGVKEEEEAARTVELLAVEAVAKTARGGVGSMLSNAMMLALLVFAQDIPWAGILEQAGDHANLSEADKRQARRMAELLNTKHGRQAEGGGR
jgi:hypothetical protein